MPVSAITLILNVSYFFFYTTYLTEINYRVIYAQSCVKSQVFRKLGKLVYQPCLQFYQIDPHNQLVDYLLQLVL